MMHTIQYVFSYRIQHLYILQPINYVVHQIRVHHHADVIPVHFIESPEHSLSIRAPLG
uniref:Uncharacterized protein n=1 Tax=Triticum urartu TaxID=4572 RepID=A0A8R7PZY8_TRIUA